MKKNVFQMWELEAYLGDYVGDYDIDGIIDQVTEIDASGNRVWSDMDEAEFQAIVEAHDMSTGSHDWYMTVDIDNTYQEFTSTDIDTDDKEEARELLRMAWNAKHEKRLHLASDTKRIINVFRS